MARLARAEIFDPSEIVAVHLIGKTVRSCYLMGVDERSGKNFDHRKRWIEEKLKTLAANFGIDLLAFSCMSNHFHLLLRSRPDVVATWDDTQVAMRWWQLCPTRKNKLEINGEWVKVPASPTEFDLNAIRNGARHVPGTFLFPFLVWFLGSPIAILRKVFERMVAKS
jgi:hypothetical protein